MASTKKKVENTSKETKIEESKKETKNTEPKKETVKKNSTAIDSRCPSCGAKLIYDPKTKNFICKYCKNEFNLEQLEKRLNSAASKEKNKHDHLEEDDDATFFQYNCPDCGAVIVADEQTSATFCVYCGNTAILKNKLAGKFHPSYIIPFKKTVDEAKQAFKNITKGRMFVPKNFNNEDNIEKIRGIYIPFWLYDMMFTGTIDAKGDDVKHWTSGRTHYTKTDTYDMHRKGNMTFEKVPVDGSSRFENDLMNSIEPFNYNELEDYNHAYLSGFLAEKYDIDEQGCYDDVRERVMNSGIKEILATCHHGLPRIYKSDYNNVVLKFYYVLLPVYMVNVKYDGKYYTFAMNGQTGKFVGNIPLNKRKVVLYTFLSLIICAVVIELIIVLAYVLGGNL